MTSLFNIFSDLDSQKHVSNYYKSRSNTNNTNKVNTTSLTQGQKFMKYQKKIAKNMNKEINYVNSKEGFTPNLSQQTHNILKATDNLTNTQAQVQTSLVNQQFNSSLSQFEDAETGGNNEINDYYARINPKNPYLNTNIRFTTGETCYVTNQGVVKWYPNPEIWNSTAGMNGCPASSKITQLNIPWEASYNNSGTNIPTNPPLITGTPMTQGQSCGYEGTNVYVNEMVGSNVTSSYKGCFADNSTTPAMTFIGPAPPTPPPGSGQITNPDFDYPEIAANSYQYISSNTTVPGWDFYAVLINNSQAWSYPMPYPNGNQAACIQATQIFGQVVYFSAGTYNLSFYSVGRPTYSSNTINVYCSLASDVTTPQDAPVVFTFTPPNTAWQIYNTTLTISLNGSYDFGFYGTIDNIDNSVAIQHIIVTSTTGGGGSYAAPGSGSGGGGSYTEKTCKDAAMYEGYKYYALQDTNSSGYGYCAVSNNYISATQYGNSTIISNEIVLWQTNTTGTGNTATLNESGCLVVINSSGTAIFTTPNNATNISTSYIGCYGDGPNRAFPIAVTNGALVNADANSYSWNSSVSSCQQAAQSNGYSYFGLQDSTVEGEAVCFVGSNLQEIQAYGAAGNCTTFPDGTVNGGAWSNSVYSTGMANPNYFLSLTDDGLLAIYLGSGPTDQQELIWSYQGNVQQPNPLYAAENGIVGNNWIPSGFGGLAAGDFVGSPSGYCVLLMESTGNLVFLTFQTAPNCATVNGTEVGGIGANAIYELSDAGTISNMGQLAYIDQNSTLYPYETTNTGFNNSYTKIKYFDSSGNNIPNATFSNATLTQCESACEANDECYGFSIINGVCYPKNNQMYPVGQLNQNQDSTLYIRNKIPITPPYGVNGTVINNINSNQYQNYNASSQTISDNGESINGSGGVFNILNPATNPQIQNLQNQLTTNAGQMLELSNAFNAADIAVNNQSMANIKGIKNYEKEYNKIQKKIKYDVENTSGILDNSDIKVLQQNYNYMFWSILAIGTVIISMNIVKK
jgi:hypothetical protein